MAEEALNLLLRKVGTILSEEANLLGGVRKEVEDIEYELIGMHNFLTTGEASIVKNCLDEVRELAYDTEDCIDSFRLHIASESRPNNGDGWVFLGEALHYLMTLVRRHQISKEIKKVKAKAERLHEIRSRYPPQLGSLTQQASLQRRNDARSAAPCFDVDHLVVMEESRQQLKHLLLDGERQLTVISVVGTSGLGKTTMASKLFEDEHVRETFDYRAWISISQLSNSQVLLGFTYQLSEEGHDLPQGLEFMSELQLAKRLERILRYRRYMIILDDVKEKSVWERISGAFPVSDNGSRVMITSQIHDIASYDINSCGYLTHVYQLPVLRYGEAWDLFCMKAFRAEFACPQYLKDVAERIVKRCAGLPLAIVTVGGLLADKPRTLYEWNRFGDSLIPELQSNDRLASVQRILSLGYDDLPAHLKPCILCFGAFQEIKQTRLLTIWIAEGFVQEVEGRAREEVAMDYLKELANRSMVQMLELGTPGRTTKICRVHGFMHEILKFKCMEQSAYTLRDDQQGGNRNQNGLESPEPPPRKIRRLPVKSTETYGKMASLLCGSGLRSLFITIQGDPILFPSPDLSDKFAMLRMLDLEGTKVSRLSGHISSCRLLRYLSLRDTKLDCLPKSLGELLNLETLDLRGTWITRLPAEVTNLHRLRHLHVSCPNSPGQTSRDFTLAAWYEISDEPGVSAPPGVRKLTGLENLALLDIVQGDSVAGELQDLTQLRKLGVRRIRSEDGEQLCAAINKMSYLRSLVLHSVGTDEPLHLQSLSSPPPLLENLFLAGPLEQLPTWTQSLHSIVNIVLIGSRLMDDPFDAFQDLPNLTHLSLIEAFAGRHLRSSDGGFKQLKMLHLSNLNVLELVTVEEGAMPALGRLSIWYCGALQQVPSGIEHLTRLEELHLLGMHEEFVRTLRDGGIDRSRVEHIPSIRSTTEWQDGNWIDWVDELELSDMEEGQAARVSFTEIRDGDTTTWIMAR